VVGFTAAVVAPVAAVVVAVMATVMTIIMVAVVATAAMVVGEGRGDAAQREQRGHGPDHNSIHAHVWPRLVSDGSIMLTSSERFPAGNGFQFNRFDDPFRQRQGPPHGPAGGGHRFGL